MRAPVVLHTISSFDQNILESTALTVVSSLYKCIDEEAPLRSEIIKSPDFWSILQRLHQHENAASVVFDLLKTIIEFSPPVITADNYESAVNLANDFASAGSVAAATVNMSKEASRRTRTAKQPKAR